MDSGAAGDVFGYAVDISSDGTTAVAGAPGADECNSRLVGRLRGAAVWGDDGAPVRKRRPGPRPGAPGRPRAVVIPFYAGGRLRDALFRDDDGAYVISTDNLEWSAEEGEWTVLAQKKRKSKKEEYEGYVINAQLRRMIARSLPARDVQRK